MKVLQIYKDYFPPVFGGIERHVNLLSTGLRKIGIETEVLVSNTCFKSIKENIDGIPVTRVLQIGRLSSAPINPTFSTWLRKLARDVDILHFHLPNPTADLSYLFSRINRHIVVTYHSDIVKQANLFKLYYPFLLHFLSKAKMIISTSTKYLNSSSILNRFRSKCIVIPLGINLSAFTLPDSSLEVRSIRQFYSGPLIIFIGQFRYYKGLHILIEAMKNIDGKLLLVGAGNSENRLRQQVAQSRLTDKVFFLGKLTDERMLTYLQASDILILPSHLRSEAFGIVQLEAMACEKPVISTELGTGTSSVNRNHETGLVVPPNNPEALATAANYLIDHPAIRRKFGKIGRHLVETHYNDIRMVEKIADVYRRVLEKKDPLKPRPSFYRR
ncbi:MAG: glycosyltransferase [Thermodesulfobacteriota bacterium]